MVLGRDLMRIETSPSALTLSDEARGAIAKSTDARGSMGVLESLLPIVAPLY